MRTVKLVVELLARCPQTGYMIYMITSPTPSYLRVSDVNDVLGRRVLLPRNIARGVSEEVGHRLKVLLPVVVLVEVAVLVMLQNRRLRVHFELLAQLPPIPTERRTNEKASINRQFHLQRLFKARITNLNVQQKKLSNSRY